MSNCLVLVGLDGCGKDKFCDDFLMKYQDKKYKVIYLKDILIQLYGKGESRNKKIEDNLFLNKIEQKLLQGENIIIYDFPLSPYKRKSFLRELLKVDDARISCVDFTTPFEICKKRSTKNLVTLNMENIYFTHPDVEEGWQGILRYNGE